MDMSVNPDGMDSTDYSDFEYQTVDMILKAGEADDTTGDGNITAATVTQIEPLGGIGGLDNNEVAELVYLETEAFVDFADDAADQDVASTGFVRGVVGANLSDSQSSFPGRRSIASNSSTVLLANISDDNVDNIVAGGSEDRWFQPYTASASLPFDDQANGPGGSGSNDSFHATKAFRDLVGRGPVLDSSDDMSIAAELNVDDTILNAKGVVTIHMVWDVAETSDAGRAFSVPMDD